MADTPELVRNSFLFVPGIGTKTEEFLWKSGITSWSDLASPSVQPRFGKAKWGRIRDYVADAEEALKRKDIGFFRDHLPQNEYWRLYGHFRDETLFVDVETTGLSRYYDNLTIIGAYDGRRPHIFVKDINLSDAANVLSKHPILVTFNGTLFDLPFIRKELPDLRLNHVHIDLRFLLRTIGLSGGLKKIELKLGIPRAPELESVEGRQAAVLWREFLRRNNDDAIRKLVLYNLADTINLRVLMEYCYIRKLQQKVLPKFSRSMFNRKIGTLPKINGATLRSSWLEPSSQGLKMRSNRRYVSLSFKREKLVRIDRTELRWRPFGVYGLIQQIKSYGKTPRAVGIDLSGSEARPTGISILDERRCELDLVHTDKQIIEKTLASK